MHLDIVHILIFVTFQHGLLASYTGLLTLRMTTVGCGLPGPGRHRTTLDDFCSSHGLENPRWESLTTEPWVPSNTGIPQLQCSPFQVFSSLHLHGFLTQV